MADERKSRMADFIRSKYGIPITAPDDRVLEFAQQKHPEQFAKLQKSIIDSNGTGAVFNHDTGKLDAPTIGQQLKDKAVQMVTNPFQSIIDGEGTINQGLEAIPGLGKAVKSINKSVFQNAKQEISALAKAIQGNALANKVPVVPGQSLADIAGKGLSAVGEALPGNVAEIPNFIENGPMDQLTKLGMGAMSYGSKVAGNTLQGISNELGKYMPQLEEWLSKSPSARAVLGRPDNANELADILYKSAQNHQGLETKAANLQAQEAEAMSTFNYPISNKPEQHGLSLKRDIEIQEEASRKLLGMESRANVEAAAGIKPVVPDLVINKAQELRDELASIIPQSGNEKANKILNRYIGLRSSENPSQGILSLDLGDIGSRDKMDLSTTMGNGPRVDQGTSPTPGLHPTSDVNVKFTQTGAPIDTSTPLSIPELLQQRGELGKVRQTLLRKNFGDTPASQALIKLQNAMDAQIKVATKEVLPPEGTHYNTLADQIDSTRNSWQNHYDTFFNETTNKINNANPEKVVDHIFGSAVDQANSEAALSRPAFEKARLRERNKIAEEVLTSENPLDTWISMDDKRPGYTHRVLSDLEKSGLNSAIEITNAKRLAEKEVEDNAGRINETWDAIEKSGPSEASQGWLKFSKILDTMQIPAIAVSGHFGGPLGGTAMATVSAIQSSPEAAALLRKHLPGVSDSTIGYLINKGQALGATTHGDMLTRGLQSVIGRNNTDGNTQPDNSQDTAPLFVVQKRPNIRPLTPQDQEANNALYQKPGDTGDAEGFQGIQNKLFEDNPGLLGLPSQSGPMSNADYIEAGMKEKAPNTITVSRARGK